METFSPIYLFVFLIFEAIVGVTMSVLDKALYFYQSNGFSEIWRQPCGNEMDFIYFAKFIKNHI